MTFNDTDTMAKAGIFFERAAEVALTGNFDYAIDLYIEGLTRDPEALQDGHIKLHQLGIVRKSRGGKPASMLDRVKKMGGKTPLEQMLNAEYLFVKDPENLVYAEAMLKAAIAGKYTKTAKWLADFLFQVNNESQKPSAKTFVLIKDSYKQIGDLERAVIACQFAVRLKPEDIHLAEELKNLSAELAVSKGNYGGDFRDSLKDRQGQEKLQAQDGVVKSDNFKSSLLENAKKEYIQDPNLPKNIYELAEALTGLQDDQADQQAINLLEKAAKEKKDFSFQQKAGLIRISREKRRLRHLREQMNAGNSQSKAIFDQAADKLNQIELEHYRLCMENYPTDLAAKYEYGVRLIRNNQCDLAIPLLQEAQRDPRRRILAMDKVGLCFFMKAWFADAIDIFNQAISEYEIIDDGIAKELRYNLARAYEEDGQTEKALELFRKLAQLDFGFRDVRQRVDQLRNKINGK